jgi:hypothetical protein
VVLHQTDSQSPHLLPEEHTTVSIASSLILARPHANPSHGQRPSAKPALRFPAENTFLSHNYVHQQTFASKEKTQTLTPTRSQQKSNQKKKMQSSFDRFVICRKTLPT